MPARNSRHRAPRRRPLRGAVQLAVSLTVALSFITLMTHMPQSAGEVQVRDAAAQPTTSPTDPAATDPAATDPAAPTDPAAATDPAATGAAAPSAAPTDPAATGAAAQAPAAKPKKQPNNLEGRKGEQQVAPDANTNCTLQVPARPLSARGLATPYQLSGTGGGGPCNETNADQGAFVEAAIINPRSGALRIYHPLVVDQGTQPAATPVVPKVKKNAVVGIWFGFNGDTLTLSGTGNSLGQGKCVNGLGASLFGQYAYCHAGAFFTAANKAITNHKLTLPRLGMGNDGMPCPTVRDFGIVDQDQSDNVNTTYLATADGRTAQNNAAAANQLGQTTELKNGSDNALLASLVDPAIGCTPFTAPDITNNGAPTPALALNELHAAARQRAPVALIPLNNPMTLVNDQFSVAKTNLYRVGVNQPPINPARETPQEYCTNIQNVGNKRLATDQNMLQQAPSPDAAFANLFDFMTDRLAGSLGELKCAGAAQ